MGSSPHSAEEKAKTNVIVETDGNVWNLCRYPNLKDSDVAIRSKRATGVILRGAGGFTLIELAIVLVLVGVTIGITSAGLNTYNQRVAAQHAAQLFVRDLSLARAHAVRGREPVVIRFSESSRWYSISSMTTGRELLRRRFNVEADIGLEAIDLETPGDTVFFTSRGILSGVGGQLGTATFSTAGSTYAVSFNIMGASKVEQL
jgi:prepilin-type N-terminal cleavage/methylation domain-containing protein